MHAVTWIFDFMNFMIVLIKSIKFKPVIKFEKLALHNYGLN